MSLAAIILAAGASRRMGSPKALLSYRGETFIDRLAGVFAESCQPVIVVLGFHAGAIRSGMRRSGIPLFVDNPDPERGQLSSLQCGLRAVPEGCAGALFMPVDFPAVRRETIQRLIENFRDSDFVVPSYSGKHGHPILFRREIAAEFLALAPGCSARDVVRRHRDNTNYVIVDDPGVVRDVDDPPAYRELLAEAGSA